MPNVNTNDPGRQTALGENKSPDLIPEHENKNSASVNMLKQSYSE